MAGATASQADIDLLRARLGLDRPLAEQYATRLAGLARGDFGYSSTFRGNPLPHVLARLPATLILMAAAILTTVLVGLPAGLVAAVEQNRWPDYVLSLFVVGLLAVPNFWLGLMLIVVLSVERGWLPSFGFTGPASLVMPTIALAARLVALVAAESRTNPATPFGIRQMRLASTVSAKDASSTLVVEKITGSCRPAK